VLEDKWAKVRADMPNHCFDLVQNKLNEARQRWIDKHQR